MTCLSSNWSFNIAIICLLICKYHEIINMYENFVETYHENEFKNSELVSILQKYNAFVFFSQILVLQ